MQEQGEKEEKSNMWFGGRVHSYGINGMVVVSLQLHSQCLVMSITGFASSTLSTNSLLMSVSGGKN